MLLQCILSRQCPAALPILAVLICLVLWFCARVPYPRFLCPPERHMSRPLGLWYGHTTRFRPCKLLVYQRSRCNFFRSLIALDETVNTRRGTPRMEPSDCCSVVCYWMVSGRTSFASVSQNSVTSNRCRSRLHFRPVLVPGEHPDVQVGIVYKAAGVGLRMVSQFLRNPPTFALSRDCRCVWLLRSSPVKFHSG
jgi:hypothetical protein